MSARPEGRPADVSLPDDLATGTASGVVLRPIQLDERRHHCAIVQSLAQVKK